MIQLKIGVAVIVLIIKGFLSGEKRILATSPKLHDVFVCIGSQQTHTLVNELCY